MQVNHGPYQLDDAKSRIDIAAAWSLLSEHAYWGRWRAKQDFEQQIDGAWRVVAGYRTTDGALVSFSRAFSDGVATAYLADVIVAPGERGTGLGTSMVEFMIERGPGSRMRWMLHTNDAHDLYARFGFAAPQDGRYLERAERRQVSSAG